MRIYWINNFINGQLGMMPRPKGNDWLEDEIKKLKFRNVNKVVSLLEDHEVTELEIENEEFFCKKDEIDFLNFPIKDREVPGNLNSFIELISNIDQCLKENKNVVIHCRMGIGRTSLVAAGVLVRNGYQTDEAFQLLSEVRTLNVPDTEEQVRWIKRHQINIQSFK